MPPITKKPSIMITSTGPVEAKSIPLKGKERPILYPVYKVDICCNPVDGTNYAGPLTAAKAKKLLRWETESEFFQRRSASDPKMTEKKCRFGDDYLLKNYAGEKVRCWSNARNRPFDPTHAGKLAQDILNRNWELNLENIIIGCTGLVLSGQHRLCALILAVEEWYATKVQNNKSHWEEFWEEEPYLETTIAFGAKETDKVMRTYDNVKTRTLADTIFTSPFFGRITSSEDRKEVCKMMDSAVDLLWKRTKQATNWSKYQTHSSSLDFLDKHPKIEACVKHIFDNNENRIISNLKLNPGACAGMMYLMGSGSTDGEEYYYPQSPKEEKQLKWDHWDKATEFWNGLVDSKNEGFNVLRNTLSSLQVSLSDMLDGAVVPEKVKQMVLSIAWNVFLEEQDINEEMLDLKKYIGYNEKKERLMISEEPTVGGIDCGVVKGGSEVNAIIPRVDEQEETKKSIREQNAIRMSDVTKGVKTKEVQEDEEGTNPLIEQKQTVVSKGKPVFSEEERAKLLSHVKPNTTGRDANNQPIKMPKAPPKPTLKAK